MRPGAGPLRRGRESAGDKASEDLHDGVSGDEEVDQSANV